MEKEAKIIFNPSDELVEFSKDFSDKYRILSAGTYESNGGKYRIDYLEKITDKLTGKLVDTAARIGHDSKVIQLDRHKFMAFTENPDLVFFLILWLAAKVECEKCKNNDTYTDIFVLGYYLTTGRSIKNMALGFLDLIRNAKKY